MLQGTSMRACTCVFHFLLPGHADCNDDISDCSIAEKDALRDWEGRFYSKYKIVGKIVSSKS